MGETGSGKSTLLLTLNGSIPHLIIGTFTGDVIVAGKNTKQNFVYTLSKHVGLVFEDPDTQIVSFTVIEDIAFGPGNLNVPKEELKNRIAQALKHSRLEGYENRNPRTLSGGEKQSLAIAGILAMNSSIIVMDEPTSMLDPIGRKRIYSIIKDLNKNQKKTIVFSGQEAEVIAEYADRIILMNKGKIERIGTPQEIFEDDLLCEKLGIRRPQVTEFARELQKRGLWSEQLPITLEQAVNVVKKGFKLENIKFTQEQLKKTHDDISIKIHNLSYKYQTGSKEVLKEISLEVHKGEILALIGQNGSGKTTLAKILVGLLQLQNKDSEVVIAGENIRKISIKENARKINYVFQNPDHQLFSGSVEDEIEYGLKQYKIGQEMRKQRLEHYLDLFMLKRYRKRRPKSLARGLRTLTAISSVLILEPEIVIIDEPTTGLDRKESIKIMDIVIKNAKKNNQTIIFITHEMDLAARYAERIIVLNEGEILLDGSVREVFSQPAQLQKSHLNPPQITQLGQELGLKDVLFIEELVKIIAGEN